MIKAPELLPCPFCGGQHLHHRKGYLVRYVECNKCGAYGPNEPEGGSWNTRTDTIPVLLAVEREKALKEAAEGSLQYVGHWEDAEGDAAIIISDRILALIDAEYTRSDTLPAPKPEITARVVGPDAEGMFWVSFTDTETNVSVSFNLGNPRGGMARRVLTKAAITGKDTP